jgi:hypothetical protein
MKTSELYISYFKALQDKWENPIREFLKDKLSYNLRRNKMSHGISVEHIARNGDLIMLLQLEKLIEEFENSKFHPLNCGGLDFNAGNIIDCIGKNRILEEGAVTWDSLTRRARNSKIYSKKEYNDFPNDKIIEDGPFEILELYGVYRSRAPRSFRSQVEIFISKIYYDCLNFGWDVEALYVIVLCHELAHGYHHIGIDSDDNYWVNYSSLDINIKEGLAQHYTQKFITANRECSSKNFIKVFDDLCKKQPKEYSIHKSWPNQSYEATRIVMVESKIRLINKYKPFKDLMIDYKKKGI